MNGIWRFLALMMIINVQLQAQFDRSSWSFGLLGGMQRTQFTGTFQSLPGLDNFCN